MIKKLPYKIFIKSFELVPRVAINLLIENDKKEILLTKRTKPPFKDFWHYPGSFLLKGETIEQCIERVANEEMGISLKGNKTELLGVFEDIDKDQRGHVIDIIYGCKISENVKLEPVGDTKEMKFFIKLPTNIGFNHRATLNKLGWN